MGTRVKRWFCLMTTGSNMLPEISHRAFRGRRRCVLVRAHCFGGDVRGHWSWKNCVTNYSRNGLVRDPMLMYLVTPGIDFHWIVPVLVKVCLYRSWVQADLELLRFWQPVAFLIIQYKSRERKWLTTFTAQNRSLPHSTSIIRIVWSFIVLHRNFVWFSRITLSWFLGKKKECWNSTDLA